VTLVIEIPTPVIFITGVLLLYVDSPIGKCPARRSRASIDLVLIETKVTTFEYLYPALLIQLKVITQSTFINTHQIRQLYHSIGHGLSHRASRRRRTMPFIFKIPNVSEVNSMCIVIVFLVPKSFSTQMNQLN